MRIFRKTVNRVFLALALILVLLAVAAPGHGRHGRVFGKRPGILSACRAEVIHTEESVIYRTLPQGPPGAVEHDRNERKKAEESLEILRHLWIDLNIEPKDDSRPAPRIPPLKKP